MRMNYYPDHWQNKIKFIFAVIILTLVTTYLTVRTYENFIEYSDLTVFTITPLNTDFSGRVPVEDIERNSIDFYGKHENKNRLTTAYQTLADFFSPTRTLVPIIVILPEYTNPQDTDYAVRDNNMAIAQGSREHLQEIDHTYKDNPQNIDQKSDIPIEPSQTGGGGGGSGGSGSSSKKWNVITWDEQTPFGEKGNTVIADIFKDARDFYNRKLIYPGIGGKYNFTVDNSKNHYDINYTIRFTEEGLKKVIPMRYRLKIGDNFINNGNWLDITKLNTLVTSEQMKKNKKVTYILEWQWPESDNDSQYIQYGGYEYILKITVYAEAR